MQYNSVEDAVSQLELQIHTLTKTCDAQSKQIENLEDTIYHLMLLLLNERNETQNLKELTETYINNCNLFSKKKI